MVDAPEMSTIQMAADPNCARLHSSEVLNEFVVVGEGGTLANAFVHIKSGITGNFPPTYSIELFRLKRTL